MSIFFPDPPEPKKPPKDYLWLALAGVGGLCSAILLARLHWALSLAGLPIAIIIGGIPAALLRRHVIGILHDASASRAHERFLRLTIHITSSPRYARRHWGLLRLIAQQRKHPNAETLHELDKALAREFTEASIAQARDVALHFIEVTARTRSPATANLATYLGKELKQKGVIVLYGFSTAVCDAIAALERRHAKIIVIEDQQYGTGSQREHERVTKRLSKLAPPPQTIRFHEVERLITGQPVITDLNGSAIKHGKNVPTFIILGCEAYAVDGTVLIPALTDDDGGDTGRLIELIQGASAARRRKLQLIIVAETYKLRTAFAQSDEFVGVPLTYSATTLPRLGAYLLTGAERFLPKSTARLLRLPPPHIRAIVDDFGIHTEATPTTLTEALQARSHMLRAVRAPRDPGFAATCDAYILDMNGVLANDELDHQTAFVELVREHQCTLTQSEYAETCLGRTDLEGVNRLIEQGKLTGTPDVLVRRKQQNYRNSVGQLVKPYRHAVALVQHLVDLGKKVYLVTACSREDAHRFVTGAGLAFAFNEATMYTDVTNSSRGKVYQEILSATGLDPGSVVVVDDSPANLRLAQTLRLHTIGVQTTRPQELRADQLVRDADDLYSIIKGSPTY